MIAVTIGNSRRDFPGSVRGVRQIYADSKMSPWDYTEMLQKLYQHIDPESRIPPEYYARIDHNGSCYGCYIQFDSRMATLRDIMAELDRTDSHARPQMWQAETIGMAFPMPTSQYLNVVNEADAHSYMTPAFHHRYRLDGQSALWANELSDCIDFVARVIPTDENRIDTKRELFMIAIDPMSRVRKREEAAHPGAIIAIDDGIVPDPHILIIDSQKLIWREPKEGEAS